MVASAVSSTNIDINSIVSQLMAVERQPIAKLTAKEADYQAKLTSYGTLKGALSSFEDSVHGLNSTSRFQSLSATPSDTSILTAFTSSIAAAGTYSLEVTSLAKAQTLIASGQASVTDAIGTGTSTTVTFDFGAISGGNFTAYNPTAETGGTYSGSTFTSNGLGTQSITIDSGNNTLSGIRDAINAADMGVTATIINDGDAVAPYRLVLNSDTLGASSSLNISVSGDATISNLLTNNPGTVAAVAGSNTVATATKVAAANAGTTAGTLAAGALIANTSAGAISIGAVTLGTDAKTNGDAIALAINTALAAATGGAPVNGTAVADVNGKITITAGSSAITLSMGDFAADSAAATANQDALIAQTGFDATQLGTQAIGAQKLAQTITATNANLIVNGVAVSKSSNAVSDVIHGVTLNLLKATTSPITLTLAPDKAGINTSIASFIKTYNDLAASFKTVSAYDPTTRKAAALHGDSTVRSLQAQLRSILGSSVGDATVNFRTLSDIGVTFQRDGTLALNQEKLDSAMTSNFSDIAALFTSANGYANKLDSWATSVLVSDGHLASRTDGISRSITDIGKRRDAINVRLIKVEQNYRAQFTALDSLLSSMNTTSTYLTQQLAQLSNNN